MTATCTVPGCVKPFLARGFCAGHYRRTKLNDGDPLVGIPLQHRRRKGAPAAPCAIDGCSRPMVYTTKGWCAAHYSIALAHDGNPYWVSLRSSQALGMRQPLPRVPSVAAAFFRSELANPSSDGCRIWPYSKDSDGYGYVSVDGKHVRVHAAACEWRWGPKSSPDLVARHGPCRNPSCWAWEHVTWGTPGDNFRDRWRDGTEPVGEQNGRHKLTEAEVLHLRARYAAGGITYRQLATAYGVSQTLIAMTLRREIWTHVAGDKPPPWSQEGERANGAKLTDEKVRAIRARWAAGGIPQAKLAADYGVTRSLISMVVTRKIWKHLP